MGESPWAVTKPLPDCATFHGSPGASIRIDRDGYVHANGHVSAEPIPLGAVVNIVVTADSVEWRLTDR